MQERLELVEKLQQTLWRAETLPEVEAEQAQRVAALSKVLLWVPGGQARGGPVPVLSHHAPARAAQSTQHRRRGGSCCPSEMGALPECQAAPASASSLRKFPSFCPMFCVSPGCFSSESQLLGVQSATQSLAG